jgi:hypothetical protein
MEGKGPLSPVYELMLAVEAGVWPRIAALASRFQIQQDFIAQSYWDAMQWAQSIVTTG